MSVDFVEEIEKEKVKETIERIKQGLEVIPGTSDIIFKTIMIEDIDYLCFIIHHMTDIPYDMLYGHIRFKNVEYPINKIDDKKGRSDIIVDIEDMRIILEMNTSYYKGTF